MSDQKQHSDDAPSPPILHEKVSDQISETDEASSPSIQHEKVRYVLRKVRLRNFVKFEDLQELSFKKNGAYYLIGENQSGKSSVFEGIRRCLSLENNSSVSSFCVSGRDSIVVCNFEGENSHNLISFYIRQADSENKFSKGCVLLDQDNKIIKYGVDHIEIKNDKFDSNESVDDTPPEAGLFEAEVMAKADWLDRLTKWMKQFKSKYKCETLLEDLNKNVVFTLPMRGIGALQWTKSEKTSIKSRKRNYEDACERAEVINWYLKTPQENMEDEKTIYDVITNGKGGEYSLDGTNILNNGSPILKLSEGFLEAKLCSILLSSTTCTTVGLEDPGTGMHIQMIERLRNVMTSKVTCKDKVVIVSTHNPHFIKPELIENMYFLHRLEDGKCIVIPGTNLSGDEQLMHAIPGSVSADQFATLCFAEQTAFVEGQSDIQFMDAFSTLLRKKNILKNDIHLVSMGGALKLGHFINVCKALQKKYFFLLDKDVKTETLKCIQDQVKISSEEAKTELEKTAFFWDFTNIECLFFEGVFDTLKRCKTPVTKIKEVIKKCVNTTKTDRVTFTGNDVIDDINYLNQESKKHKFKIFLHGRETFEDRIKLFEYLMDETTKEFLDSTAGKNLTGLRDFMEKFTGSVKLQQQ